MTQQSLQVPLFSAKVIRSALSIYESMKGEKLESDLFDTPLAESMRSQYLPSRSLTIFLNYLIAKESSSFVIDYFDTLMSKRVIPDFIASLEGTPATLEQALKMMVKATKIQTPLSDIRYEITPQHIALTRARIFKLFTNQNSADLFTFFFFRNFIKAVTGQHVPIREAHFVSPASSKIISILAALKVEGYLFDQENQRYLIDGSHKEAPVVINRVKPTSVEPAPISYLDRLRAIIDAKLSAPDFSIQDVANELGVSVRSLQNRLTEQNSSFKSLKDERILQNTIWLRIENNTKITDIALLLGFRDLPQFSRSIKRISGCSPKQLRDQLTKRG